MSFSGDLKGIGLPDVLQNLQANRLTGTLRVEGRPGARYVEITQGAITGFSLGPNKGLPLNEHLVHRRFVTRDQLKAALDKRRGSRKPLRVVLAQGGVLDEDGFRLALREVMCEQLCDLLGWSEATFAFTDGPAPARVFDSEQRSAEMRLEIGPVLMESARRIDELQRIGNVIGSDCDVFVRLDVEATDDLDEVAAAVLDEIDGRSDVGTLVRRVPYLRFDVLKALAQLVSDGLVRPCGGVEIEAMAARALADGDDEGAVVLLGRALDRERNNQSLRQRLVEVLLRLGRNVEAANELALLGYAASKGDDPVDAVDYYARASELAPDDVTLAERYVEALEAHGEPEDHGVAAQALADRLLAAGLAERAAAVLTRACGRPELRADLTLLGRLAETEEQLGHTQRAAELWRGAADLGRDDVPGALQMLRRAARLQPGDHALARRIVQLETGYAARARRRRRRLLSLAAAACCSGVLATAGITEFLAARAVIATFESNLDEVARGVPAAAVVGLENVRSGFAWTGTGRTAERLVARLVELQVRAAQDALAADDPAAAISGLERLQSNTDRRDQQRRLEALLHQAHLERHAQELLAAATAVPPLASAAGELARLVDPELLTFHLRHVERVRGEARTALLKALRALDDPRAVPAAARLYVAGDGDVAQTELVRGILQAAGKRRSTESLELWGPTLTELQHRARDADATAERARQVLDWLLGM
ncbi:MAG: DUF4388 domain-containing protein [Planctomycetota bacterium]